MFKKVSRKFFVLVLSAGLLLTVGAVTFAQNATVDTSTDAQTDEDERPAGWGEETHSNDADPNYAVVFPQAAVNQITITVDAETWTAMQANMTEIFGAAGTRRQGPGGGFGGAGRGEQPTSPLATPATAASRPVSATAQAAVPAGVAFPPAGQGPGGGGPGFGGGDFATENPMWVTATIEFEGDTWTNVGVRYKGNSSLRSAWDNKSLKLPFKLDFDEFEDEYPAINNQRFYGFKQLSLANNFGDATGMRDTLTYDLLEEAGLVAAETAAYEVILDYGEGPVSLGLYTMIEVIDDTVIGRYFDDDGGNIYEADGQAISLAEGTEDGIETSFQKENNEDDADWSDIEALYEALHAEARTTDPEAWRAELESVFDVESFLEWLAISATIQHWDTYGGMTHNFYLYHDPETDQLTWISWDHNLVLGAMGGRGGGPGGFGGGGAAPATGVAPAAPGAGQGGRMGGRMNASLDKAEVGDNWPLIRYLMDDPTYYASYIRYLEETRSELFDPEQLTTKYQRLAEVLAPYAAEEMGATTYETAVQALMDKIEEQAAAVETFLDEQATK